MYTLADCLPSDASPVEARPGIYSLLPEEDGARYDARAAAYDRVVGSWIYNRLLWGTTPARYRAFVRRALADAEGELLDAGSGSAVFTAEAYVQAARPIVLVDRSLGMLEVARDRLCELTGGTVPNHVVLLQADVKALPFRAGSLDTVLSMGMLHLFEDAVGFLEHLLRALAPDGTLFATSLVAERGSGRQYLRLLHWAGEVATPRSYDELRRLVSTLNAEVEMGQEGSMAFLVLRPASGLTSADPPNAPTRFGN